MRIFFLSVLSIILCVACKDPAHVAVPVLIKNLSAKDSHTRNTAALKLGSYGKDAEPAVPKLIHLLSDTNGGVRTSAAFALRSIGTKEAIQALDTYEK